MILDLARLLLFPALVAFAGASDLFTMTISNRISLVLIAGFAVLAFAGNVPLAQIAWHLAAGGTVLVVAFIFFSQGWIGGGDAKLAAVTALWLGFDHMTGYLVYASLFGGALTLLIIQFRLWHLPAVLESQSWAQRLHNQKSGIPYGIALAAAALMIYPDTLWMRAVDISRFAFG